MQLLIINIYQKHLFLIKKQDPPTQKTLLWSEQSKRTPSGSRMYVSKIISYVQDVEERNIYLYAIGILESLLFLHRGRGNATVPLERNDLSHPQQDNHLLSETIQQFSHQLTSCQNHRHCEKIYLQKHNRVGSWWSLLLHIDFLSLIPDMMNTLFFYPAQINPEKTEKYKK